MESSVCLEMEEGHKGTKVEVTFHHHQRIPAVLFQRAWNEWSTSMCQRDFTQGSREGWRTFKPVQCHRSNIGIDYGQQQGTEEREHKGCDGRVFERLLLKRLESRDWGWGYNAV